MSLTNFDLQIGWSNFIQVPSRPTGIAEDAGILINFPQKYDYEIGRNGAATITHLVVDIVMPLPGCWVVSSELTNTGLLKHEQGHYDLTALGAREFHDTLTGMSAKNELALQTNVKSVRSAVQARIDRANLEYDRQTSHSQDKDAQERWRKQIDSLKSNPKGLLADLS